MPISSTLRYHLDVYLDLAKPPGWFFPSPSRKRYDIDNFNRELRTANDVASLVWSCLD